MFYEMTVLFSSAERRIQKHPRAVISSMTPRLNVSIAHCPPAQLPPPTRRHCGLWVFIPALQSEIGAALALREEVMRRERHLWVPPRRAGIISEPFLARWTVTLTFLKSANAARGHIQENKWLSDGY